MRYFFLSIGLLLLSLALIGCASAAPQTDATQVTEPTPGIATYTEEAAATEQPTATEGVALELLQVGDLVPFAPAWFDTTQLTSVVFAENDHLYIYTPLSPNEPGQNIIFGGVTADTYINFDLTASFNLEGGFCYPEGEAPVEDNYCGNLNSHNCIVFAFLDSDNFQNFCIFPGNHWYRGKFEDGAFFSLTNLQNSDAISDMGLLLYRALYHEVPAPNELRLRMQDGVLYGYVNGQQLFEQDLEAGTTLTFTDGTQTVVFEQIVDGKIGVGCSGGTDPNSNPRSNCDVTVLFGTP